MTLEEYKPGAAFAGLMGRTVDGSSPSWPSPERARSGSPDVLFIIIDDTGFGQFGCNGSPINTPKRGHEK
jgi:arylsulfatase